MYYLTIHDRRLRRIILVIDILLIPFQRKYTTLDKTVKLNFNIMDFILEK